MIQLPPHVSIFANHRFAGGNVRRQPESAPLGSKVALKSSANSGRRDMDEVTQQYWINQLDARDARLSVLIHRLSETEYELRDLRTFVQELREDIADRPER